MAIYKHHIEYQKVTKEGDFHILYPKNTIEDVYLSSAQQSGTIASKLHFFGVSESFPDDSPLIVSCDGITEKNLVQGIHISVMFKNGVNTLDNTKYRFFIKIKELNKEFGVVHNDATDANIQTLIPPMGIVDLVYYNDRFQIVGNQHKTGSGNNHIPEGGKLGQILRWNDDGVATWGDERSDTTYPVATENTAGIMSATMADKLNNIEYNANNYIHPESSAGVTTANVKDTSGDKLSYQSFSTDKYGHVTSVENRVFTVSGFSKSDHDHNGLYASISKASELDKKIETNYAAIANNTASIKQLNLDVTSIDNHASTVDNSLNEFKKKYNDEAITKYTIGNQKVNSATYANELMGKWYSSSDASTLYTDSVSQSDKAGGGFKTTFYTGDGNLLSYYSREVYDHLHDGISNHLYVVHLIYDTAKITPTDRSTVDITVTGDVVNNHTGITSGFSTSQNFDKVKAGDCLISANAYFYELGASIKFGLYTDAILEQYHADPAVAAYGIPDTSFTLLKATCIFKDYDNEATARMTITNSGIFIGVDLVFYRP